MTNTKNINTDFIVKFTNKNSKEEALKFVSVYRSLISQRKQEILSQCYDFSFLSASKKFNLDKYFKIANKCSNSKNNKNKDNKNDEDFSYIEDSTYDDFLTLKALVQRKKHPHKIHRIFDKYEDDEVYTYSISKTRELLYLCSKTKISPTIIVHLEKIDIYNPVYTYENIKSVVNDMRIDYITIKV